MKKKKIREKDIKIPKSGKKKKAEGILVKPSQNFTSVSAA